MTSLRNSDWVHSVRPSAVREALAENAYDGRMPLSRRSAADARPNAIALARARLDGAELLDLSDSNPTRHGLTDPAVSEVLARAASREPSYDPDPRGSVRAREALAARFGGAPDDYWLTPGTSTAYAWLFALLTDVGDQVAVPRPGYPLVEPLARLAGVGTVPYPAYYLHPHGWEYDLDALTDAVDPSCHAALGHASHAAPDSDHCHVARSRSIHRPGPGSCDDAQDDVRGRRTRAVVVVHPNNPTGAYADAALAAACPGVPLIVDEVFWPFWLRDVRAAASPERPGCQGASCGEPSNSRLSIPPRLSGATETLTFGLDGLSKLLAAPHLKLGWIRVSGPRAETAAAAPVLDRIADAYLPVSGPLADALPDLLDLADATVARVRTRLLANLATAQRVFSGAPANATDARRADGLAYRVRRADGGWTVLVDVPRLLPDDDLVVALLGQGLAVHPGWLYDLDSPGTLALSLLPRPDAFAVGCDRLQAALAAPGRPSVQV